MMNECFDDKSKPKNKTKKSAKRGKDVLMLTRPASMKGIHMRNPSSANLKSKRRILFPSKATPPLPSIFFLKGAA